MTATFVGHYPWFYTYNFLNAPIEPCHSTPTPPFWIFARSLLRPSAPSTWRMVLHASMGIRKMRKLAAAADEATDFTAVGRFFVSARESSSAIMPALEAVSPKRERGPWMRAGPTPR